MRKLKQLLKQLAPENTIRRLAANLTVTLLTEPSRLPYRLNQANILRYKQFARFTAHCCICGGGGRGGGGRRPSILRHARRQSPTSSRYKRAARNAHLQILRKHQPAKDVDPCIDLGAARPIFVYRNFAGPVGPRRKGDRYLGHRCFESDQRPRPFGGESHAQQVCSRNAFRN